MDSQIDEYERTLTTIMDAIGTLGGIYSLIQVFFGFFIGIFSNKLFYHYVVNNMHRNRRQYYEKLKLIGDEAREDVPKSKNNTIHQGIYYKLTLLTSHLIS